MPGASVEESETGWMVTSVPRSLPTHYLLFIMGYNDQGEQANLGGLEARGAVSCSFVWDSMLCFLLLACLPLPSHVQRRR